MTAIYPSTAAPQNDPHTAIAVSGLSHAYTVAEGSLVVIDGLDFAVRFGETVAITGPSGAGKTTLLSLIGGLDRVQQGSLEVAGRELRTLSSDALAEYRRNTVGFVFQDYGLLPTLSAAENVELALSLAGVARRTRRARARELLELVGLTARIDHRPAALSGGESQRVAIARALANEPRVVLADEPTGNLDEGSSARVLELLAGLPAELDCAVVMVTHNPSIARQCDREFGLAAVGEPRP